MDSLWGKFRLPKVYRYTYSNHLEGPAADREVNRSDIPALFRNYKKMDVSHEYFETQDVTVTLTEPQPEGARYAYLAVFGQQQWQPVQWGKIRKDGTVTFKGMGKDIVYMPVYFKEGTVYPAASPFKLESDGEMRVLSDNGRRGTIYLRLLTGAMDHGRQLAIQRHTYGSRFVSLADGKPQDELCTWNLPLFIGMNHKQLPTAPKKQRYVRMYLPTDTVAIGEIAFYTAKGRLSSVKPLGEFIPFAEHEGMDKLTDGADATVCQGMTPRGYLDFDLGDSCQLTGIGIYPYLKSQILEEGSYALQYWDNGWKLLEIRGGTDDGWVKFEQVPLNALLILRELGKNTRATERIFVYEEGNICWE